MSINNGSSLALLTNLQMVLLHEAELNQESLAKDYLSSGQNEIRYYYYSLFLQDIFRPCRDESSVSVLIYHGIKLKVLSICNSKDHKMLVTQTWATNPMHEEKYISKSQINLM